MPKEEYQDGRHIWLYAKGWYRWSDDLMADLRILVGHHTGIELKYLSDEEVFWAIMAIAVPHIKPSNVVSRVGFGFENILYDLVIRSQTELRPITYADVLDRLLLALSSVKVRHGHRVLINLGEPDYTLLPKNEA